MYNRFHPLGKRLGRRKFIEGGNIYDQNTIPQGLYPSASVVYSEGMDKFLKPQQDELNQSINLFNESTSIPINEQLLPEFQAKELQANSFMGTIGGGSRQLLQNQLKNPYWSSQYPGGIATASVDETLMRELNFPQSSNVSNTVTNPASGGDFLLGSEASTSQNLLPSQSGFGGAEFANPPTPPQFGPGRTKYSNFMDNFRKPGNKVNATVAPETATTAPVKGFNQAFSTNTPTGAYNVAGLGMRGMGVGFLGQGIDMIADDMDPTTITGWEGVGKGLKGAGTGMSLAAGLGSLAPALAVPGLGWAAAGIGGLVSLLGARRRRNEAREQQEEIEEQQTEYAQDVVKNQQNLIKTNRASKEYSGYDYGRQLVNAKEGGPIRYQNQGFLEGEWDIINQTQQDTLRQNIKNKLTTGINQLGKITTDLGLTSDTIPDFEVPNDPFGTNSLEELKKILLGGGNKYKFPYPGTFPPFKKRELEPIKNKNGGRLKYQSTGPLQAQPDTLWNKQFVDFSSGNPKYQYLTTDWTGQEFEGLGSNDNNSGTVVNIPVENSDNPFMLNTATPRLGGKQTLWPANLRKQLQQRNSEYYANKLFGND